jgi:signal transduction histidine kinase
LHSSKLETLGLAPSINSLCVEFAKQHRIRIQFGHANVPSQVSSDTALYLFRIAQEGLHNVRKHSGASEVSVHLKADSDTICLTVLDNGRGIEADGNHSSKGIGIESMKERARLLGGRLEIQSRPWVEGTQIRVVVPMTSISVPA